MITKNSVLASAALADEFAQKGVVIGAKPNTIVAELTRLTTLLHSGYPVDSSGTIEDNATKRRRLEYLAEGIENATTGTLENPGQHALYTDSVLKTLSQAVLKHISFAKNTVKPIVVDYVEMVQQGMASLGSLEPSSQFKIDVLDIPEVLLDSQFTDLLKFYESRVAIVPDGKISLGPKTNDEIIALLQIGDGELDAKVAGWFSRVDPALINNLWENIFRKEEEAKPTLYMNFETVLQSNVFERVTAGLMLFLAGRKLFDSVDESAQNIPLAGYQNLMAQVRDFGGCVLATSLQKLSMMQTAKTLVVDISPEKKSCTVFGEVYRPWLASGGSPETLFGLIVSRNKLFSQALIDNNKVELDAAWKTYCVYQGATEANTRFARFKDILGLKFRELMASLSEEELAFANANGTYYDNVNKYLQEELDALKMDAMQDLHKTALQIVCRSRFFYTDAEKILSDIHQAAIVNPNIRDVREAALVATIQYVVDYIADQMYLIRQ